MWDSSICGGYAVNGHGYDYGHRFLPRIQKLVRRAIREYTQTQSGSQEQTITALRKCGHTLAKVLDEYNYTKFTLRRDLSQWESKSPLAEPPGVVDRPF
jgi:hypothetical protein